MSKLKCIYRKPEATWLLYLATGLLATLFATVSQAANFGAATSISTSTSQTSGALTEARLYKITGVAGSLDFTTCGSADNTVGTLFVANSTPCTLTAGDSVNLIAEPNQVVSGDFDGDNKLDLAFADVGHNKVILRKGSGTGTFTSPWESLNIFLGNNDTGGGDGPFALAVGDFDQDGHLDIAVANVYSDNISVFLNKGLDDGTFFPATVYAVGVNPTSITAADFDGDDYPDLAVTNYGDNTVSVLKNDQTGRFGAAVNYGTGLGPWAVTSAILTTGSGTQDLIVANYADNSISILTGKGDGTFNAKADTPVGSGPTAIVTGKFNAGDDLDIAVTNFDDSTVSVLLSTGPGAFAAPANYDVGLDPISIATGDFNGTTAGASLAEGDALVVGTKYTIAAQAVLDFTTHGAASNTPGTTFVATSAGTLGAEDAAIEGGGDGILDLAVANRADDNISVLRGNTDGTFTFAANYPVGDGPSSIITYNLTGGTIPALVTANRFDNTASVLLAQSEDDAPTGSIAIVQRPWYDDRYVQLTLSAVEEGDGAKSMCISNTTTCDAGSTDWMAYATSYSNTLAAGRKLVASHPYKIISQATLDFTTKSAADNTAGTLFVASSAGLLGTGDSVIEVATLTEAAALTIGTKYKITGQATLDFATCGAGDSNVGTSFTADAACVLGTGDSVIGDALPANRWTLTSGDGLKTVYAWFKDARGNISERYFDTTLIDTTAPGKSVAINDNDDYTNNPEVTLSLSGAGATDMKICQGVDATCLTGASWDTYAPTSPLTLTGADGTKTVYAQFKNSRKTSDPFFDSIVLDSTAPAGTIAIDGGNATTRLSAVTLNLTAADAIGGAISMCLSDTDDSGTVTKDDCPGSSWAAFASSAAWTLPGDDGVKTVYAWFKDLRNNVSEVVSDSITLQTAATPTGSIVINGGNLSTDVVAATLALSASDNAVDMCITNNVNGVPCDIWIPIRANLDWTLGSANDGTKTVYAKFRSKDGVVSAVYSDAIQMDTTPPVMDGTSWIKINDEALKTNSPNVSLTMHASDLTTVVAEMCISNTATCTDWKIYSETYPNPWPLAAGADGERTVRVWFKDAQGNATATSKSATITLDTTPPTGGTVAFDDASTSVLTGVPLTLGVTTEDVDMMRLSNSNVYADDNWIAYAESATWNLAAGAEGVRTVYVWFKDALGNRTQAPVSDTIIYDTTAPTAGSVSINAGAVATASATTTLTISASDATADGLLMCVSNTTSCTAGTGWIAYATSKPNWELSAGDGVKTVRVWFKDALGNTTAVAAADTIILDTTAPTGSVMINNGAATTSSTAFTLTLASADSPAPMVCISNTNDTADVTKDVCPGSGGDKPWLTFSATKTWTITPAAAPGGDGDKTVYVWFKDALGNVSGVYSDAITLDRTAPTGSISIAGGASYTKTAAVTLTLTSAGATQMCVSNTNTCTAFVAYAATKVWSLTAGNGEKTVYVWYRDATGNTSVPSVDDGTIDTITLDGTAPSNGTVTATNGVGEVNLTWTGFADVGSSVASYKVAYSSTAAPVNCTGATNVANVTDPDHLTSYNDAGVATGTTRYYRVCAVDMAGNISTGVTASAKSLADATAPGNTSITITEAADGGAAKTTTVHLTLSATDLAPVDGAVTMCISNTSTCTTYIAYATTKVWTLAPGNGAKVVSAWFRDSLGNTSAPVTAGITLDTTPPTNGTVAITTPESGKNKLDWTGFGDGTGSGIARYKVVYGLAAPASCAAGTPIYNETAATGTTYTHSGLTNGTTYYYRVCAIDKAGNVSTGTSANSKPRLELIAPTGTVKINDDALFTKTAAVTLALTIVDDPLSTPYQMCISNTATCTAFIPYAATKAWTLVPGNGSKSVNVWLRDKWGNTSDKITPAQPITLDTTVPTNGTVAVTTYATQNDLTWSGFSDVGSAIDHYKVVYSTTASPTSCAVGTTIYTGADPLYTHAGLTNGTFYYYRICGVDKAGNVSTGATITGRSIPEADGPTGTISINADSEWTNKLAVTLTLSATDASGVTLMCVSNTATSAATCTPWVAYATSKTWTLATSAIAEKTVKVWFKDKWGTPSVMYTDTINYDAVKPVDGAALTATPGAFQNGLSWNASTDALSGVASYKVVSSTTTSAPATCSTGTVVYEGTGTSTTHLDLASGTKYYYRVCAIDNAGNMSLGKTAFATPTS